MKKKIVFLIIILLISTLNVKAATTPNGINVTDTNDNSVHLECSWGNGTTTAIIEKYNIDGNQGYVEFNDISLGSILPSSFEGNSEWISNDVLSKNNFYNSSTKQYDCPLYLVQTTDPNNTEIATGYQGFYNDKSNLSPGSYLTLDKSFSKCEGKCNGNQQTQIEENKKTCDYKSSTGKTAQYIQENSSCKLVVDGQTVSTNVGVCSLMNQCPDFYYEPSSKSLEIATYDFNSWFDNHNNYDQDLYNFICNNKIEYFCSGNCEFPANNNINCDYIYSKINPTSSSNFCEDTGILKALRIVGYFIFIAKILIPVILIVTGSMDFGKAVIEGKEDSMKKASNSLIRRAIIAVLVFLIPTVINYIFGVVIKSNFSDYNNCRACIFDPNNCNP